MFNIIFSVLTDPQQLIGLIIVFLLVYWFLSIARFFTSVLLKVLIAFLVVSIISYFIGVGFFEQIGFNHWLQTFYEGFLNILKVITDFLGFTG
jgi:uncharacterized membrane protein YGL010W